MKFYVINSKIDGCIFDVKFSLANAKAAGRRELGPDQFTIDLVECPVNAETIRLMLIGDGGYATKCERVFGEI
jgi:hypothetical protein